MELSSETNHDGDAIARTSPELALVDPELSGRLRRRLRVRPRRMKPPLPVLNLAGPDNGHSSGASSGAPSRAAQGDL